MRGPTVNEVSRQGCSEEVTFNLRPEEQWADQVTSQGSQLVCSWLRNRRGNHGKQSDKFKEREKGPKWLEGSQRARVGDGGLVGLPRSQVAVGGTGLRQRSQDGHRELGTEVEVASRHFP